MIEAHLDVLVSLMNVILSNRRSTDGSIFIQRFPRGTEAIVPFAKRGEQGGYQASTHSNRTALFPVLCLLNVKECKKDSELRHRKRQQGLQPSLLLSWPRNLSGSSLHLVQGRRLDYVLEWIVQVGRKLLVRWFDRGRDDVATSNRRLKGSCLPSALP